MRHAFAALSFAILTFASIDGQAAAPSSGTLHPEKTERAAYVQQIRDLLNRGDFEELERIARDLLADDPRNSCGVSKLVDFYSALEPSGNEGPDGPEGRMATFAAWSKAKPTSHWTSVGNSVVESSLAWKSRGNGSASSISPEQWESHKQHTTASMDWARKALADGTRDPQLFGHLIGLCRALEDCPREQAERWLASAVALNPNYDGVYIPMANYLLPRWLGSSEEFTKFAERVSDENKAVGNIAYVRIATVGLLIERDKFRMVYPAMQWERIHSGLLEIDRRYPDSTRTYHLLARFARLYEDRGTAREAMSRLSQTWDADAAGYWDSWYGLSDARKWAMADAVSSFPNGLPHHIPLRGHGFLDFGVPEAWMSEVHPGQDGLPPTIKLWAKSGPPFDAMLTPLWPIEGVTPPSDSASIKSEVSERATAIQEQAVEKSITVQELRGTTSTGYYFSATDRSPQPGEFKYMTQGLIPVGDVVVAFTVLTNEGQDEVIKKFLAIVQATRHDNGGTGNR